MRGFLAGVFATVLIILIAGYLALRSGLLPANADAKPGGFELWAAGTSLDATLQKDAPKGQNPMAMTDANLTQGANLYGQHCAVCHGTAAGDTGASAIAKGLYPAPPQFATEGVEDDPDGVTYWKIKHGIRLTGMPSWKSSLSERQMWTIALFLKHINKLPPAAQAAWLQVKN